MKDIIVDVDGTLANCEHRQHFLRSKPKNWKAFNAAILQDGVHHDIVWLVKTLKNANNRILICSARTDDLREKTIQWLHETAEMEGVYDKLYMRQAGDYRDDGIVKLELLEQIRNDGYDPTIVIDDRDRVVTAWRQAGLRCLQVAPGNF